MHIPGPSSLFAVADLGEFLINLGRSVNLLGRLFVCGQGAKCGKLNRRKTLDKENFDLMNLIIVFT